MKKFLLTLTLYAACTAAAVCSDISTLRMRLCDIADKACGTVGIAFVCNNDTLTINNNVHYPMMSVFKLHQALAVADTLERTGQSYDRQLHIRADELDHQTWSPMLSDIGDGDFDIPVGELVKYAIVCSDNNASNILFDHIISPAETDRLIRQMARDTTFAIAHSESQMKADHTLSYRNYSSPLACALLIRQVFEGQTVSARHTAAITEALLTATTGQDRLGAPLKDIPGIRFGHKTGSGYRNTNGELIAHNDVAYVMLPDGTSYALAVMIRDFAGTEAEASAIMTDISAAVIAYIMPER